METKKIGQDGNQNDKMSWANIKSSLNLTVIVAALGYFVDLFDITIFAVVRVASLNALGYTDPKDIFSHGLTILNSGMIGMIVGGLLWGVLSDKFGRLSVLFGSILLYSIGTLANAFVWDAQSYALCRFLSGIGLAGELGAGITLVAESLPSRLRGIGTTVVAGLGILGSVAAVIVGNLLPWKGTYILGGVMGLILLAARIRMFESTMFQAETKKVLERGSLKMLLKSKRFFRYLRCVLLGTPIYFVTGVLFTFSIEVSRGLGLTIDVNSGHAILFGMVGMSIGDFLSGFLSQMLKSRKKPIFLSLVVGLMIMLVYLTIGGASPVMVYLLCFLLGASVGFWAVLITVAAEQFGTNLRGTVATTVPNFVRGSAVIATLAFKALSQHMSVPQAALVVGSSSFFLAFLALFLMEETFGRDLDFSEVD